jgi:ubiquinone/menaquinone biosynthesis C-methylase UbiE
VPARSLFDAAATEYDAARPSYPDGLYDALEAATGPLLGKLVLDCGAGTGIASRQLAARGARVFGVDLGEQMLRMAVARSPGSAFAVADGHRLPVRASIADLITFAQCWHWFDQRAAAREIARVLKPGGHWAAWWNRAEAYDEEWFERYMDALIAGCPSYTWAHLDRRRVSGVEWSLEEIVADGLFEPVTWAVVPWTRRLTAEQWLTDDRSKSYLIELDPADREAVLAEVAEIIADQFPDGQMQVPYSTKLIVARRPT